jgi:hypothetical protein
VQLAFLINRKFVSLISKYLYVISDTIDSTTDVFASTTKGKSERCKIKMNPKIGKLAVDATIAIVLALLILLYVFLFLGDTLLAIIAFLMAVAISLGTLLVMGSRHPKTT